jgi:hypothetical protein
LIYIYVVQHVFSFSATTKKRELFAPFSLKVYLFFNIFDFTIIEKVIGFAVIGKVICYASLRWDDWDVQDG